LIALFRQKKPHVIMNIIHIFDISRVTQDHAERWRFRDDNLKFFALIDIKAKKIVRPAQQTKLDHHRKLGMKVKTARLGQKIGNLRITDLLK